MALTMSMASSEIDEHVAQLRLGAGAQHIAAATSLATRG
jgi:hypothetical protein